MAKLVLNGVLKAAGVPQDNATLAIAARDLEALTRRRFGEGAGAAANFVLEPSLASYQVRVAGGELLFAGKDATNVLYAVYHFCEQSLGYFFWAPGEDLLDATGPVELSEGVVVEGDVPLMNMRAMTQEFPFDDESPLLADWMAKNQMNCLYVWLKYFDKLDDAGRHDFWDRGIEIYAGHHHFSYWIQTLIYGHDHPEWFAMVDGKRIKPSPDKNDLLLSEQLCTTNPELRKEIARRIVEYANAHPQLKRMALIPNDGFGWCECPECSKFYDKNHKGDLYSVSKHVYIANDIYHDMVRDVAAQVAKSRPDLRLCFSAYVNYCRPGKGMKLTSNLGMDFAPYWRCINHRLDDPACPINSKYVRDLKEWAAVKEGGELTVYEYYMGVNFYLSLPMIHHHDIFAEVKFLASIGVDGLMTQFHIPHWTVYGLNYRMMADALRGRAEAPSVARALQALYGPDADEAEALYMAMRAVVQSAGPCHVPYPYSLLNRTRLEQYEALLERAKALLAKAPENRLRQENVIWCEYMVRFKRTFDLYHEGKVGVKEVDEFLDWIHAHQGKGTRVLVPRKFDVYFNAWKECIRTGREWLHFNIDWEDEYVRIHRKFLNGVPEEEC
jgi:hypothetical protein